MTYYRIFLLFGSLALVSIIIILITILTPSDNYQHGNLVAFCFVMLIPVGVICIVFFPLAFQYKQKAESIDQHVQYLYRYRNWYRYWHWYNTFYKKYVEERNNIDE